MLSLILLVSFFLASAFCFYCLTSKYNGVGPSDLSGRCIVITGAAGTLGRSLSLFYGERNAYLILIDSDETRLLSLAADLSRQGLAEHQYCVLARNLDSVIACKTACLDIFRHTGHIDVLFMLHANLARNMQEWRSDDESMKQIEGVFMCNFFSHVYLFSYLLPLLEKGRRGKVVLVSSIAGLASHPFLSIYSSSKFAMTTFFDCISYELELKQKNVSISKVYLGLVESDHSREHMKKFSHLPVGKHVVFHPIDKVLGVLHQLAQHESNTVLYYPWFTCQITRFLYIFFPKCYSKIMRYLFSQ